AHVSAWSARWGGRFLPPACVRRARRTTLSLGCVYRDERCPDRGQGAMAGVRPPRGQARVPRRGCGARRGPQGRRRSYPHIIGTTAHSPAVLGFPVEFRKDDVTFEHDLEKLDDAARFANAIGCLRMVTYIPSSSETPKRELRALYKRRFSASAAILAKHDVRLGLEFLGPLHIRQRYPYEFIWRMPEMLQFAQECGFNCGLLLDSWHWHHAGATVDDIISAGKRGIVHVHFNDAAMQPPEKVMDQERLMPGE